MVLLEAQVCLVVRPVDEAGKEEGMYITILPPLFTVQCTTWMFFFLGHPNNFRSVRARGCMCEELVQNETSEIRNSARF